jgi:eukaryotic-like serine/threonine-protein kinase
VHYAHQHGILHRDLKPANILLNPEGRALVTDFGLARMMDEDSSLTLSGQALGSPNYMPPELAAGQHHEAQPTSDVYSLGAVLYELLSGRPPFVAQSVQETLIRIREEPPIAPRLLNSGIPRDLETIALKCLEKEPSRRYASARELAADLGRFLRREPIHARPASLLGRTWGWCRRKPALAAMAAALGLALTAGFLGVVSQWRRAELTAAREAQQRTRAEESLRRLELRHVEESLQGDQAAEGLAWLAYLLRKDPGDRVVGQRLMAELTYRSWPLPAIEPLSHEEEVHYAEFSPDGRRILTASLDNAVRLWDVDSGRRLGTPLRHNLAVIEKQGRNTFLKGLKPILARFSPDGERVATASVDNSARLWDAHTGEPISPPLPHRDWVASVAFSPDGAILSTACKDGSVFLWNGRTGEPMGEFCRHDAWANFAEFSPDGTRIFTGADDGSAQVWDLPSRKPVGWSLAHGDEVKAGVFSPDGTRVATASADGTARIWNATTGEPKSNPLHHEGTVVTLCFSPDGCWLATASFDQTVRLWDGFNGAPRGRPLRHGDTVRTVQFSPEGRRLLTASEDKQVRVWDVRTGVLLMENIRHQGAAWSARWSSTGSHVVTASSDRTAKVMDVRPGASLVRDIRGVYAAHDFCWAPNDDLGVVSSYHCLAFDLSTGQILGYLGHEAGVNGAEFAKDGQRLLLAGGDSALLCDARSWKVVAIMQHRDKIGSARFDHEELEIITASADGTAAVWDSGSYRQRLVLSHPGPVLLAEFSPEGTRLMTASGGTIRIWDRREGQLLTEWTAHSELLTAAHFSPDGNRVLTASRDGTACIWEIGQGTPVTPRMRHRGPIYQAWFSPDATRVLTASEDDTAQLWDAQTGHPLGSALQHRGGVLAARFSLDGALVATASDDMTVRLWDGWTGQPQCSPLPHPVNVNNVAFSHDGTRFAVAVGARSVRLWNVVPFEAPAPEWLASLAEDVAGLKLSEQQELVPIGSDGVLRLRHDWQSIPSEGTCATWGQWFLADRSARTADREWFIRPDETEKLAQLPSNVGAPFLLSRFDAPMALWPEDGRFYALAARDALNAYRMRKEDRFKAEAEWLSRRALELSPENEFVWRVRADYLTEMGDAAGALRMLAEGRRLAVTPAYWLQWGRLLEAAGQLDEAMAHYSRALELLPVQDPMGRGDRCAALLARAGIHEEQGRFADARTDRRAAYGVSVPARDPTTPATCLDLSEFYNANLDTDWLRARFDRHNLALVPRGRQTLGGIEYDLRGGVQLADPGQGPWGLRYPTKVAGIPVQRRCQRIHFLHAMAYRAGSVAGNYTVHFRNGQTQTLPLRVGDEIYAWDRWPPQSQLDIAWQATNAAGLTVQLFHYAWTNPQPDEAIEAIDFSATPDEWGPFLIAISVDE